MPSFTQIFRDCQQRFNNCTKLCSCGSEDEKWWNSEDAEKEFPSSDGCEKGQEYSTNINFSESDSDKEEPAVIKDNSCTPSEMISFDDEEADSFTKSELTGDIEANGEYSTQIKFSDSESEHEELTEKTESGDKLSGMISFEDEEVKPMADDCTNADDTDDGEEVKDECSTQIKFSDSESEHEEEADDTKVENHLSGAISFEDEESEPEATSSKKTENTDDVDGKDEFSTQIQFSESEHEEEVENPREDDHLSGAISFEDEESEPEASSSTKTENTDDKDGNDEYSTQIKFSESGSEHEEPTEGDDVSYQTSGAINFDDEEEPQEEEMVLEGKISFRDEDADEESSESSASSSPLSSGDQPSVGSINFSLKDPEVASDDSSEAAKRIEEPAEFNMSPRKKRMQSVFMPSAAVLTSEEKDNKIVELKTDVIDSKTPSSSHLGLLEQGLSGESKDFGHLGIPNPSTDAVYSSVSDTDSSDDNIKVCDVVCFSDSDGEDVQTSTAVSETEEPKKAPELADSATDDSEMKKGKRRIKFSEKNVILGEAYSPEEYERGDDLVDEQKALYEMNFEKQLDIMERIEVTIKKGPSGFGFQTSGTPVPSKGGNFMTLSIGTITPNSPADLCKKIQTGDVILEINGNDMLFVDRTSATNIMRGCTNSITLLLAREMPVKTGATDDDDDDFDAHIDELMKSSDEES